MAAAHIMDLSKQSQLIFNGLNDVWGVKDKDSKYVYASEGFFNLLDIPYGTMIYGLTDFEIPTDNTDFKTNFSLYDMDVVNGSCVSTVETYEFNNIMQSYLFKRIPVYDGDRLLYCFFCGSKLMNISSDYLLFKSKRINLKSDFIEEFSLTEKTILWLLLARFEPKEIAINISTSVGYVRNVKQKALLLADACSLTELRHSVELREWMIKYPPTALVSSTILIQRRDLCDLRGVSI